MLCPSPPGPSQPDGHILYSGGVDVSLMVAGVHVNMSTYNIIAEVGEGNAESIVIAGAHLDSVEMGPGAFS